MKKLISVVILSIFLSGCSLIPKINFNTPNTVPQSTIRNRSKDTCKGKAEFNEHGDMIFCSKGYYSFAQNYIQEERRFTFQERISNFIRNLKGYAFWIFVALLIFCPALLGLIIGRIVEAVFGISHRALVSTVRGIQKTRKEGKDINDSLSSEQDTVVKKYINKIKEKEHIK